MWAGLALLAMTGGVPPFQLLCVAASAVAALVWLAHGENRCAKCACRRSGCSAGGLFGYRPPISPSCATRQWSRRLIALLTAVDDLFGAVTGRTLARHHLLGAGLGFAGAVLRSAAAASVSRRVTAPATRRRKPARIWSSYSVLSRRVGEIPTGAVGGFCLAAAVLALPAHLIFETTQWPRDVWQWLAVLGLGLGPVGGAFFTWDIGVKRGDIQVLGALAYGAPLLSTVLLVATGWTAVSWPLAAACALIVGGGLVAARICGAERPNRTARWPSSTGAGRTPRASGQVRMGRLPVQVGKAIIQIGQRDGDRQAADVDGRPVGV